MKIKTQFIITMLLFGIIFLVITASMLITNGLLSKVSGQQKVAENIALWASDLSFLSIDYLIYHEEQQMKRLKTKYEAVTAEVAKLSAGSTAERALISNIKNNQNRLKDVFTNVALYPNMMPGYNNQAFDPAFFQVAWSRLAIQSQSLVSDASWLTMLLRQRIDNLSESRTKLMYFMAGMFGVFLFVSYLLTYRRVLESIKRLHAGTKIIGSGNLDFVLSEQKNDEIGDLSLAFNQMTANLKNATASKIELEKEITERKLAEAALRESEEKYRNLFMNMSEEVQYWELIRDRENQIITCKLIDINPPTFKTWGKSSDEAKGKTFEEIFGLEAMAHFIPHIRKVVAEDIPYSYEDYLTNSDKYFRFTIVPLENHIIITGADITESKKAQTELRKLNRTLRALSESNQAMLHAENEPAYLWEICHIIVETCGYLMAWIGYKEDDEAKTVKPMAQSGHGNEYVEKLRLTWSDLANGQGPTEIAIRTGKTTLCRDMHTDPNFIPWREESLKRGYTSSIALPLSAGGKVIGSLNIYSKEPDPFSEDEIKLLEELARDLAYGIIMLRIRTQNREAEKILRRDKETLERLVVERSHELINAQAELERTKRLSDIGTLAATVAHELRNPLAAIAMAAYNINKKAKLPAIGKHLDTIEKKVNESDQIINNLLFYSRLRPPSLERVDAFGIIEECIETIEKQPKKEVHIIREQVSRENMVLEADSIQIKEVFNNILNNALDAVPPTGGEIRIITVSDAESVKVTVKDNGPGIDQSITDKIFDPFFTTKAKGTGLGLSVCRQIITMHRGKIVVESEPGKGTSVKVMLPKYEKKNNYCSAVTSTNLR